MFGALGQTVLSVAAYMALTQGPDEVRARALEYLTPQQIQTLLLALKGIAGLGLLRTINQHLNRMALNHWKLFARASSEWNWNKEIAVITGASRGFGEELAKRLIDMGVHVVGMDVLEPSSRLRGNPKFTHYHCDLSKWENIAPITDKIKAEVGHPSILVNNAGVGEPKLLSSSSDDWQLKILNINLLSHFKLIKEFYPEMKKRNKGHIIEVGSAASFISLACMTDYCVTKAGVLALWEGLNQEISQVDKCDGVVTTIVHPGWAKTELVTQHNPGSKLHGLMASVDDIVSPIVSNIKNRRGGQIMVPAYVGLVSGLRGLPQWVQELMRSSQTYFVFQNAKTALGKAEKN